MVFLLTIVWLFCLVAAIRSSVRKKGFIKYWIIAGFSFIWMIVISPKTPDETTQSSNPPNIDPTYGYGHKAMADIRSISKIVNLSDDQKDMYKKGLEHIHNTHTKIGSYTIADVIHFGTPTNPPKIQEPTLTPEATQESYEHQRQRTKQDFLASVDESTSGAMIANNKFRYVGKNVDLHCTVTNIPDRNFFNANCGNEDNGAIIVIQYDASELSTGQAIRVIGTVEEPMQGTNGFGGAAQFPTVKAEFME